MALFPMFMDLKDKKCLVVGGGKVAARKIRTLLEFDARITVIADRALQQVRDLREAGKIRMYEGIGFEAELDGAFLAVAATSDRELNNRVYNQCKIRNIPVNVADCPDECTFVFPAVVKRGDVVVGVTSSGASPALTRSIRERIEQVFPADFQQAVEAIRDARNRVMESVRDPGSRNKLLNEMVDRIEPLCRDTDIEDIRLLADKIIEEHEDEENSQGRKP